MNKWPFAVVPKNDRLKRYMIISLAGTGRGKEVIADNIRTEEMANKIVELLNKDGQK